MIWVDWLIIGVILISILTAFMRGAAREIVILLGWIVGAYLAFVYTPSLQVLLESHVETPELRYLIVFLCILIIFLILGALLGKLLHTMVKSIGLTGLDKTLGCIFGLARGLLLVIIFIMVANFTPIVKNDAWKSSWFIAQFKGPADELLAWVEGTGLLPEMPEKPQSKTSKASPTKEVPTHNAPAQTAPIHQ